MAVDDEVVGGGSGFSRSGSAREWAEKLVPMWFIEEVRSAL
jgi:hypothetical protein